MLCNTIEWNNAYSIKHTKIDSEHKRLFELAQEVLLCNDKKQIKESAKELKKYTQLHFTNEERFMRSIKYTNLNEHINLHKELITLINNFINTMPTLSDDEISCQLSTLLNENIVQHILIEDKKVHHFNLNNERLLEVFQWDDVYKLDHPTLDNEHKELFKIALRALNYTDENTKEHIRQTINDLYKYMRTHFKNEERFMEKIDFPNTQEHKEIHNNIIEEMNDFIKQLPDIKINHFEKKLLEFIDVCLVNHIIYEDKKIFCYLQSKG